MSMKIDDIEIKRAIVRRWCSYAFSPIEKITLREWTQIEQYNIYDVPGDEFGADLDLEVLRDLKHPRRDKVCPGPLISYVTDEDQPKGYTLNLTMLFLSPLVAVREAGVKAITDLIATKQDLLGTKSKCLLETGRRDLLSDLDEVWRPQAIVFFDTFNDDGLLAIHKLRQCLAHEYFSEHRQEAADIVLSPKLEMFDMDFLNIYLPAKESSDIERLIEDIINDSEDLETALNTYYERIGFLPLAPDFSAAEIVCRWFVEKDEVEIWDKVWHWANKLKSPVAIYHACSIFIAWPSLIPNENSAYGKLWGSIAGLVATERKEEKLGSQDEPLALRKDLATHFSYQLEAQCPGSQRGVVAVASWWLAEQIAMSFPQNQEAAGFYRKEWVQKALVTSTSMWYMAGPFMETSHLRYLTFGVDNIFSFSLTCLLGDSLSELRPQLLTEEQRNVISGSLASHLVGMAPVSCETTPEALFAFDVSPWKTIKKWAELFDDEHSKALPEFFDVSNHLAGDDEITDKLRKLLELPDADRALLGFAVKKRTFTEDNFGKVIFDLFSEREWREEVLDKAPTAVFDLLSQSFVQLAILNPDTWGITLPHAIAELCEKAESEERLHLYFLFLAYACLATDSTSALKRVIRGSRAPEVLPLVNQLREQMKSTMHTYPPWVTGKLRAVLASMYPF